MLVGRADEQRTIDALVQRARDGRSAVLVIRGEPGIGKSALLEHAESAAEGMRLLRCVGVESEHELPFAGMHQLVRPSLDLIDRDRAQAAIDRLVAWAPVTRAPAVQGLVARPRRPRRGWRGGRRAVH